jgi:hypothetical protein
MKHEISVQTAKENYEMNDYILPYSNFWRQIFSRCKQDQLLVINLVKHYLAKNGKLQKSVTILKMLPDETTVNFLER